MEAARVSDLLRTEVPMRSFIHEALLQNPEATREQIGFRWRARRGETLREGEEALVSEAYELEAPAARASLAGERHAAGLDAPPRFALTKKEIVGIAAAVLPFVITIESTAVFRQAGVDRGSYFSLGGLVGGLIAVALGIVAVKAMLGGQVGQGIRLGHIALGSGVFLLGAYHLLHGLGVLHGVGIMKFG